jgi:uncharacterized protein (DUF433 family)
MTTEEMRIRNEKILSMYADGISPEYIALEVDLCPMRIRQIIVEMRPVQDDYAFLKKCDPNARYIVWKP